MPSSELGLWTGPSSGRVTLEGFPCVGLMGSVLLRIEAMMDGLLCRASWPEGLAVIML
jgi:hypothetical protein